MSDLLWPGDERAGDSFGPEALLGDLVAVEHAWLDALVAAGVAPAGTRTRLDDALRPGDATEVADGAEASGNPVVPLVALLRHRLDDEQAARWLHRGLTSQDVLDTALVLGARTTTEAVLRHLDLAVDRLVQLARHHRGDVMAGRTLTQPAVPLSFGLKAATWLSGRLDARDDLRALRFPVQVGGAAGTLAAVTEVAGDADAAQFLVAEVARVLRLDNAVPWHTARRPLTRYADALVATTDALGRIANDVLALTRPEVGELAEASGTGRGGSSTMPHKANPVLSVLVRRAALSAPLLGAQLHLAAAEQVDERADGGWHAEWSALATLSRRTLTAASQAAELLAGLHVDTARMAATATAQADALLAERRSMRELTGAATTGEADPRDYLGATSAIIDEVVARATGEEPE